MNIEIIYILLFLIGIVSSVISSTIGVGGGLFYITIASQFLQLDLVVVLSAFFFLSVNILRTFIYMKFIDWSIILWFSLGAIPVTIFSSFLLVELVQESVRISLAVFLLIYVSFRLFKIEFSIPKSKTSIVIFSGVYGFFSGFMGVGAPIKAILFIDFKLKKEMFISTMGATALIVNMVRIGAYSRYKLFNENIIPEVLILIFSSIIGSYLGKFLIKKISNKKWDAILLTIFAALAIKMLLT